ncbi:Pyrimidine nucleotide transporter, mitochondrial [Coemansia spiralis]|uniref:Pyrimidine nucleotide transporter, mitochondrial n=1 Tax=Coemansia spiralis TaxID=417178 RepID=A0A9W8GMX6_9FUNG|nr:Pyrimidine nucleotide transporter, mitochondrial [Coemansia spiralis]
MSMAAMTTATSGDDLRRKKHVPAVIERRVEPWLHFVAGGLGGMIGAVATSPLDVLRTQQQLYGTVTLQGTQPQPNIMVRSVYPLIRTGGFLKEIYLREGIKGWYAGLGPALAGIIPARAIQFFTYGNGKRILTQWNDGRETPLVQLSAAGLAAVVTTTATSPIWMVKTRMQIQRGKYTSSLSCLRSIIQKEGIMGLYKGTSASYLGASESAIQWMIYERLKHFMSLRRSREPGTRKHGKTASDWFEYFGAAASAKLLASLASYPHEVLRTRLRQPPDANGMVKYKGLVHSAKIIYLEEGVRGFYGGLTPHLLRTVPNAAIMFLAYELVIYYFGTAPKTH